MATQLDLASRLQQLSALLSEHRQLWVPRPLTDRPAFDRSGLPWERTLPSLAHYLLTLGENEVDRLKHGGCPEAAAPALLHDLVECTQRLSALPRLPRRRQHFSSRVAFGVPLRKWQQVEAFVETVAANVNAARTETWIDWCGGKGHLARALAVQQRAVVVEQQFDLARSAVMLGRRADVDVAAVAGDVRHAPLWLGEQLGACALHACGELGDALLRCAVASDLPLLALAPCCPHRVADERHRPLSQAGQGHDPQLERVALRLVGFAEVAAPRRIRRRRRRETLYRVAFDLLWRETRGEDRYRTLPPVPVAWVREPFADFAGQLAKWQQIDLPRLSASRCARLLERAKQRVDQAEALGVVRALFRRPIEVYLALDRAAFVEQAGMETAVGTFCPAVVTPRNIMLLGHR